MPIKYEISGPQGNVYAVMGAVSNWFEQLREIDEFKWSKEKEEETIAKMKEGDYMNALMVANDVFGEFVTFTLYDEPMFLNENIGHGLST